MNREIFSFICGEACISFSFFFIVERWEILNKNTGFLETYDKAYAMGEGIKKPIISPFYHQAKETKRTSRYLTWLSWEECAHFSPSHLCHLRYTEVLKGYLCCLPLAGKAVMQSNFMGCFMEAFSC